MNKTSSQGGQCLATYTKADGSQGILMNTFLCGYNQDSNFYCPWSQGDKEFTSVLSVLQNAKFFNQMNVNCNPASKNCAY